MKRIKTTVLLLCLSVFSFTACNNEPKGDEASVTEEQAAANATGQTYAVDTAASYIRFTGNGVGKAHPGRFRLANGEVAIMNNQPTGGNFTINMYSLDMEEEGESIDKKLQPHLLSDDFFGTEKYPTAKFELTSIEPYKESADNKSVVAGANYMISGNLTLREQTKNVSFPAKVDVDANKVTAKADFDIDRRQWDITYGNDKSLGDQFISETVNIELRLEANKQ